MEIMMLNLNNTFIPGLSKIWNHINIIRLIILITAVEYLTGFAYAQNHVEFKKLWDNHILEKKISENIETFRKGDAVIKIVSKDGKSVSGAEVQAKQLTHEFLFGCNLYMLMGFKTDEENKKYESAFLKLHNFATLPFYWSDMERERGKVRFGKDSEFIYRRPPPDFCVEWGLKNNLTLKGHPLIWHDYTPEWLPDNNRAELTRIISERVAQIAKRYAKTIKIWEVVNGALERPVDAILPEDYVSWSFKEADRRFRPDNILMINEVADISHEFLKEDSHYYLLNMKLKLRGIRLDGIGFQFHISGDLYKDFVSSEKLTPMQLMDIYTLYGKLEKPLYITEITIPTVGDESEGQSLQAYIVRNLYRLWFSIPQMAGITWWNLSDGTAVAGENKIGGGLLNEKLEPKLSYGALDQLINQEWKTQTVGKTSDTGIFSFRGFYGSYKITVTSEDITKEYEINVSKEGDIFHPLVFEN